VKVNFEEVRKSGNLEMLARQLVEGFITGLHKSPYHGFSVEFAEHRLYNEGQSTRHIDWKVFARTDKLFTKQYEEETNLRCLIAIDFSSSMYYPRPSLAKLKFAVYSTAALAYLLHRQRDAVGLCLFTDKVEEYTPIKSSASHLEKLFGLLERAVDNPAKEAKGTNVASVLHTIAEKTHKRSLIIIFSDMFDSAESTTEIFKALQHLKHNKHEVLLFHVSDHETELSFNFDEKPYEFIDLESGDKVLLNPMDVKENLVKDMQAFHQELRMKCNQLKIDFIEAHALTNYFEVLQSYLVKRARMK